MSTAFAGKRVLVVGLAASGHAAARALAGLDAKVRVTESSSGPAIEERAADLRSRGVEVEIDGHDMDRLDADLAVVSPGIPPSAPVFERLLALGVPIVSEVEVAARLARCDLLAVTGTNGKTTTTSLLAAMLAEADIPSVAAGNIGVPLIDAVFEIGEDGAIAVEVSSFQLATIDTFHPRVAVILNIAEDHTDWHGSLDSYATAKARITENQDRRDHLVLNVADDLVAEIGDRTRAAVVPFSATDAPEGGAGATGDHLVWRGEPLLPLEDLPIPGAAGIEDSAAAAAAALSYGVDRRAVVRALRSFRPLRHRLEVVAQAAGVTYIDDSKATNPHATLAAVRGLANVVLIAGGRSKGIDLTPLRATVPPVAAVIAIGEAADEVERVFEGLVPVERAASMEGAVRAAHSRTVVGGSVLLSPGCASLDMYESYAQRGEDFARAVRAALK